MTTTFRNQNSSFSFSFVTFLFFLLLTNNHVVNSSEHLKFSFDGFTAGQESLLLQGDALITSTGNIQLTNVATTGEPVDNSVGRVLYYSPVHIWDKTTGNSASFITDFNFIINAPNITEAAEGLAFFLAPVASQPKQGGGFLGIYPGNVLAVEFDTFYNEEWDIETQPHIGININSPKSKSTSPFFFNNGEVVSVEITYDAIDKLLFTSVGPLSRETNGNYRSTVIDLKKVFPKTEYVRIGFSAATGLNKEHVETHEVLSWSFFSTLNSLGDEAFSKKKSAHLSRLARKASN